MITERMYETIRGLHISEKATSVADKPKKQLVMHVATDSTKAEIKAAVEKIFTVKVESVTTCRVKPKVKRVGRVMGKRKGWKKAYVTLAEGHDVQIAGA